MTEDVNLDNPQNARPDKEERNAPHITSIPPEAEADDLFDDSLPKKEPSPPKQPAPKHISRASDNR